MSASRRVRKPERRKEADVWDPYSGSTMDRPRSYVKGSSGSMSVGTRKMASDCNFHPKFPLSSPSVGSARVHAPTGERLRLRAACLCLRRRAARRPSASAGDFAAGQIIPAVPLATPCRAAPARPHRAAPRRSPPGCAEPRWAPPRPASPRRPPPSLTKPRLDSPTPAEPCRASLGCVAPLAGELPAFSARRSVLLHPRFAFCLSASTSSALGRPDSSLWCWDLDLR
ncbi:hypothetical protein AXF42_Ash013200 [Apostasia shenzhenica]|uniref:Uncharacterized protein n=1 Tax=Apostasia shenzhenica TaxID=1088818 RepID=A0A2I0BBD9_9ASPA|nr:hypothetical protein AXF42_Ash013200 [Apostasia shenzhenica]